MSMILRYADKRTREFAAGEHVPAFSGFSRAAEKALDRLEVASSILDLATPGLNFEKLKGDRDGQFSIRINRQRRICLSGQAARQGQPRSRLAISMIEAKASERRCSMARTPIHPGEHLADELAALGMSANELARQLGVPPNRVTSIINGTRAITGDTALRLGHFFGTSAEMWMNLQKLYELRLAEKKAGEAIAGLPVLDRGKWPRRRDTDSLPGLV